MVLKAEKKRHLAAMTTQMTTAIGPFAPGSSAKDKRLKGVAEVAEVAPFEDEDTCSGLIFRRKRKAEAAILVPSDSDGQAPSYRECPPSASSPRDIVVPEGRGKSASGGDQGELVLVTALS